MLKILKMSANIFWTELKKIYFCSPNLNRISARVNHDGVGRWTDTEILRI